MSVIASEFTFRPATREAAKLLIGLCGPSGSGKTLSALKLATGLGGNIAYVDTEQGRALQYAGDYSFMHCILPPPFGPDRYSAIVDAAVKTGAKVVIVDSVSHVWEGPGGILEQVDDARKRSDDRNAFSIWAGPKQAHQRFVNRLLQIPAHVILCFRAKEKKGLAPGSRGKMEVVDLGWHPICEQGMVYELTVNALLSAEKKGSPIFDGFDFGKLPYNMAHLIPVGKQISEDTGRAIAEWCASGGSPTPKSDRLSAIDPDHVGSEFGLPPSTGPQLLTPDGEVLTADRAGMDRWRDAWKAHVKDEATFSAFNVAAGSALQLFAGQQKLTDWISSFAAQMRGQVK